MRRPRASRAGSPRALPALVVLASALAVPPARAEGVTGYAEWAYTRTESSDTDSLGTPSETFVRSFRQRYNLSWERRLFPNLQVLVGGLYELERSRPEADGAVFDARVSKLRPFVLFRLRSPEYQADVGWSRNEDRSRIEGESVSSLIRDTYNATLGWFPEKLPKTRFYWIRTDERDGERTARDVTQNSLQLLSDYQAAGPVTIRYRGSRVETSDRVLGLESSSLLHAARLTYSDAFWNRRLTVDADYNAQYREIETRTRGTGEISLALYPAAGLASLDDTPEEDSLAPNPALIDGNTESGAGIDLGLPVPGADDRPRNLGLDFRISTEANTLLVWVDRELRSEVAESFAWEIWTSDDGFRWVRRQLVSPAPFGPFQNRFEIRFSTATSRFLKLVVRPLVETVPYASEYPNILVTELEAANRVSAAEAEGRATSRGAIADLGVRARMTDRPLLFYELTGYYNSTGNLPATWNLSNGFLLTHSFDRVWSASARFAREEGRERQLDRTAYVYSASLSAVPLPALRWNLVWSGKDETLGGFSLDQDTLFLYSIAALREGVDLNVGVGRSLTTNEIGREVEGKQANVSVALAPHPRATFHLSWQSRSDDSSGGDLAVPIRTFTRAAEGSVALRPLDALYAFASFRRDWREGEEPVETRNVALSWVPFPDGDLHVNLGFHEIYRTDLDSLQRTFAPSLRWTIRGGTFLDLAYQSLKLDSLVAHLDTKILSATLRIAF